MATRSAELPETARGRWDAPAFARSTTLHVALALAAVLLVGGALRLNGVDWDSGHHLHPDERYLSSVANDVHGPGSVGGYFDVESSPLSPYHTYSGRAYVYGELPLFATKLAAGATGRDNYGELYLVGRVVSALVDTGSIVLVFLIGTILFAPLGRRLATVGALLAAALYALSVTAIQHAHFFTVDSWLVFWTLGAFWLAALLAVRTELRDRSRYPLVLALGAAVGLAVSCKLSGAVVLVPVGLALAARMVAGKRSTRERIARAAAEALLVAAAAYISFRATSPYAFAHSSWLDVGLNPDFRRALDEQRDAVNGVFLYPPSYQWLLSHRLISPAANVLGWGLGPALGVAAVAGLAVLIVRTARRAALVVPLMLVAYVVVSFLYYGTRFAHTLRYLLPIAPFLCLAAAAAVLALRRFRIAAGVALVGVTLLWAAAFAHVYRAPNTRVAANAWLKAAARPGATIVSEHWDDALPLDAPPGEYEMRQLPVFDADDSAKLAKLYAGLHDADFYVLSSPRAWNTIGRLPDRFPLMVRFYDRLREGKLGYVRAAEFVSRPGLFGISVDDLRAEEAFSVYDHPPVAVYRRVRSLTPAQFRAVICERDALPGC
jgi:hypothetical protein